VSHNARELKRSAGGQAELIAVVKANAYGHGAVQVSRAALESAATRLAVGRTAEGVQLRRAGIEAPILLLGYVPPTEAEAVVRWRLIPTVTTLEQARAFNVAAVAVNTRLDVHIKTDTGMGRYGLLPDEVLPFARALVQLPGLKLEGLYTHFFDADASDGTRTRRQFDLFCELASLLEGAGIAIPMRHAANSAATLHRPEMALDAVRCGIALYGLRPSDEMDPPARLRPVMSLKSCVARVRTLPAGSPVSYGGTYVTVRRTPVALVQAGYGDGYHRRLSNRGAVLIRGKRAPIVGRVCMDQFVVDVSAIPGVQRDDEVVLFGEQAGERITADEVAAWADTINYEVVTSILPRVPRVYMRAKQMIRATALVERSDP
jgi:alanine racemase